MKKPVEPEFQWIKPDGRPTQYFLELVRNIQENGLQNKVSTTAPADGEVMIYVAATGLWTPGTN